VGLKLRADVLWHPEAGEHRFSGASQVTELDSFAGLAGRNPISRNAEHGGAQSSGVPTWIRRLRNAAHPTLPARVPGQDGGAHCGERQKVQPRLSSAALAVTECHGACGHVDIGRPGARKSCE
jgi:hypothetical protein